MSETGHALNVAHFEELISRVAGFGAPFNPSNPLLTLTALQAKLTASNDAMTGVTSDLAAGKSKGNIRENIYAPLRPTVTRLYNYYASTGTAQNNVDDVRSLKRKIDGKRASAIPVPDPANPGAPLPVVHSAAQTSYTKKLEHLQNIIAVVGSDPLYIPNETDIKLVTLNALADAMETANTAVINSDTALSNSRITRNATLYADGTGLFDIAAMVKQYVKALFGGTSPQYKQISGLKFKRVPA